MNCFRKRVFLLLAIIFLATQTTIASADTITFSSTGSLWFFPDGSMIQGQQLPLEEGAVTPALICFDESGRQRWTHTLSHPAVGRSYIVQADPSTFAYLYHDEASRFYLEFISAAGILLKTEPLPESIREAILYEGGVVCISYTTSGVLLTLQPFQGKSTDYVLEAKTRMTLHPAVTLGNDLFIEARYRDGNDQSAISQLCIHDGEIWEYVLGDGFRWIIKNRAPNSLGGVTLFCQLDAEAGPELYLIVLDAAGNERSRARVDSLSPAMDISLAEWNGSDQYRLYGSNGSLFVEALVSEQGDVLSCSTFPGAPGYYVRYTGAQIYAVCFNAQLSTFEVIPSQSIR
ncbi:MAG: hypothetical protein E7331_12200 [Clostridiales bacterium]|nr:hypothetical protein [Clostridiales bacterium]